MNTPAIYNTLPLFNSKPSLAHYLLLNTYRVLRPLRLKYKLTINDLVILTGCYCYHQLEQSSFSLYSLRKFIGYYNNNKIDFHINRLIVLGYVLHSDNLSGHKRYKITEKGVGCINNIEESYNKVLFKFIEKYNL